MLCARLGLCDVFLREYVDVERARNEDVIKEPVKLKGGYIAPSKGLGLSYELNEEVVKKSMTGIIALG